MWICSYTQTIPRPWCQPLDLSLVARSYLYLRHRRWTIYSDSRLLFWRQSIMDLCAERIVLMISLFSCLVHRCVVMTSRSNAMVMVSSWHQADTSVSRFGVLGPFSQPKEVAPLLRLLTPVTRCADSLRVRLFLDTWIPWPCSWNISGVIPRQRSFF